MCLFSMGQIIKKFYPRPPQGLGFYSYLFIAIHRLLSHLSLGHFHRLITEMIKAKTINNKIFTFPLSKIDRMTA